MNRIFPTLAIVALLVLSTGCISVSSYHTARPIKTGTTEVGVAMELTGVVDGDGAFMTAPRLNVRRGASEHFDIGLTAGGFGFGMDFNYLLTDSGSFALSINPALNWDGFYSFGTGSAGDLGPDQYTLLTYYAALLADLGSSEAVAFTLGVKGGLVSQLGEGINDPHTAFLGGSAGVKVLVDGIYLLPELNLIYLLDQDELAWTLGLGLHF